MRRGPLTDHIEAAGVPVIGPIMRGRHDVLAGRSLRRLLLSQPWSVVHTHLFAANFIGFVTLMTLPPRRRPPLLASEQAMAERWGRVPVIINRLMQSHTSAILVPSQAAGESYAARGINKERLHVIFNAVDVERFERVDAAAARREIREELSIAEDEYLIGTVCRLQPVKALPVLLQAIQTLPVRLVIAGDGPERERLTAIIRDMGLSNHVQLLGGRSDIPRLLASFDLFVLPSYSESFGIAVAEALVMQVPVIATSVGGIPEITHGERYARLVPPGDVTALANAIRWAKDNPELAKAQARAGRQSVRKSMSVEAVAREQHMIYQSLCVA